MFFSISSVSFFTALNNYENNGSTILISILGEKLSSFDNLNLAANATLLRNEVFAFINIPICTAFGFKCH